VIAIVMLACGLVLDAVTHTQLEVRRLLYLNAGRIPGDKKGGD
jgi:hypothetical protein